MYSKPDMDVSSSLITKYVDYIKLGRNPQTENPRVTLCS